MGERALAEGLVTPQVAELFRSGKASSDLVSVVRASLAKGRPSSSGSEGSSAAAAAKAARNRRKLGAQTSLCWGCGEDGHRVSSCPRGKCWTCTSCLTVNKPLQLQCSACTRSAANQPASVKDWSCDSAGVQPSAGDTVMGASSPTPGELNAGQPAALIKVLTESKGMKLEEAREVLTAIGMPIPVLAKPPLKQKDVVAALTSKLHAMERQQKVHAANQAALIAVQEKLKHSAQAILILEGDILELRQAISLEGALAPSDGVGGAAAAIGLEVETIARAFENVSAVLMCPHTLMAKYSVYASETTAAGSKPMEQLVWIANETSVAMQAGIAALAVIKESSDPDPRTRPRKAARLGIDGAGAALCAAGGRGSSSGL